MSDFHIQLFQRFQCSYRDEEIDVFSSQKIQELIVYLLLFRSRAHHREILATQLWDNGSTANAKKNLRQLLWHINSAVVRVDQAYHVEFLTVDRDWIQVNEDLDLWLDVAEFEQVFDAVKSTKGDNFTEREAERVELAVQLYSGDLMEGWYQDWCLYERERLHNMYLVLLDKLLNYAEARQLYEKGIQYGELALRSDPARERTHRRLMRLHYLAGNRTMALRQYERCRVALQSELGIEPAEKTQLLLTAITHERFGEMVSSAASQATVERHDDVALRLEHLQAALDTMQNALEQLRQSLRD